MKFRTVAWKQNRLELIDQTKLPGQIIYLRCRDFQSVWRAIRQMKIRGAPAIGVAAAFGIYLGIKDFKGSRMSDFVHAFRQVVKKMSQARPTARNLFFAVEEMQQVVKANKGRAVEEMKKYLLKKALEIQEEDRKLCAAIGSYGRKLIRNGDIVMTHCNAGALATAGMGTALAALYAAHQNGRKISVIATETRPFLQGARLTAWELRQNRIPVTLICDNMVGSVMQAGKVDKVIVGADRIASNGDTANKIGTYTIAELAHAHKIPFYVAAPSTTFDFSLRSGREIPIEARDGKEVFREFSKSVVPSGVAIFNPAFDVTPNELITAIITEKGIYYPPYRESLARLKRAVAHAG